MSLHLNIIKPEPKQAKPKPSFFSIGNMISKVTIAPDSQFDLTLLDEYVEYAKMELRKKTHGYHFSVSTM